MIFFNGTDTVVKDTESKKLDGVYLAIIINSYRQSDDNYLCYVYIPEVHGFINCAWANMCDYPQVTIPFQQDNDDPGHVPLTGELVKVSFDSGNDKSCRFLSLIPTTQQTITTNRDYLQYGTIPTDIITDITDPAVINKVKNWLQFAYYITIGKFQPTANDFVCDTLISTPSSNNSYYNLFVRPLTLPLASYSYEFSQAGSLYQLPIFSTNIYSASDVMLDLYNSNEYELSKLFANPVPEDSRSWTEGYNYNKTVFGDDFSSAAKLVSCEGSGIPWSMSKILYPDFDNTSVSDNPFKGSQKIQDCLNWWQMFEPTVFDTTYKVNNLGKFLLNNIDIYETEWASSVASWQTGINSILPEKYKNDNKYKTIISLCLTICPWTAIALLRYRNSEAFRLMDSALNYYQKNYKDYPNKYKIQSSTRYSYTTTVFTDATYEEFGNNVQTAIRTVLCEKNDFTGFISMFRNEAYKLFNNDKMIAVGKYSGYSNSWSFFKMDEKFDRLKTITSWIN